MAVPPAKDWVTALASVTLSLNYYIFEENDNRMKKSREETAYERAQILNPLMGPSLDPALRALKIEEAAQEAGVSTRTIRRWFKAY